MKKFRMFMTFSALFLISCNQTVGSGELDLGSLSEDATFHNQTETGTSSGSEFHYVKMDLKANGDFEQTEALFDQTGSGTSCLLKGTWAVEPGTVDSEVGNELVVTVTELNGGAVALEKRYDLRELSYQSLKYKWNENSDLLDLTNTLYADYPEYTAAQAGLVTDTFCNR